MNDLKAKIENFEDFPTLPTIYNKLVTALSDNSSTIKDIAEMIATDLSLSTKLLKLVNSTIYGLKTRITSVDKAIFHLGFKEIKNLVLTTKIIESFSDLSSTEKFKLIEFWKHSIAVGIISRIYADNQGYKNLDDFLLAGLLHDLGKLVLFKIIGKEYNNIIDLSFNDNITLKEAEQKILGIDHEEVGQQLARYWNLDESIQNVIKHHSIGFVNDRFDTMTGIVHLSNITALMLRFGNSGYKIAPRPNKEIWNYIEFPKLTTENLHSIIEKDYTQAIDILILLQDY